MNLAQTHQYHYDHRRKIHITDTNLLLDLLLGNLKPDPRRDALGHSPRHPA